MTKLEKLYASIKGLQDLGLPLNEETLRAADDLEESIIKNEILPTLSQDIGPRLSQIQRDLVLVVEYPLALLSHARPIFLRLLMQNDLR